MQDRIDVRRVLTVLFFGTWLFRLASGAAMLMTILILLKLKFEIYEIIVFSICFSLVEGICAGATGYFTDTHDARLVLFSAALVGGTAKILFYVPGYYIVLAAEKIPAMRVVAFGWFCFTNALSGIASSLKVTPTAALLARLSRWEERGVRMGLWDFVILFGRVCGFALSGVFFLFLGLEGALFGLVIVGFIIYAAGVVFLKLLPPLLPPRKPGKHMLQEAVEHLGWGARVMFSAVRRDLALLWISFSSLWGLAAVFGAIVLAYDLGLKAEMTSFAEAIILLVLGGSGPIWGRVADKIGRKPTVLIGVFGLVLTIMLGAFASIKLRLWTNDIRFWLVLMPGIFCISAFTPSCLARLADTAPKSESGLVMSGFQFITSMGEITGVVTGFIAYSLAKLFLAPLMGPWAQFAGLVGVGVIGFFWFIMTIISGVRLRSDVELRRMLERQTSVSSSP